MSGGLGGVLIVVLGFTLFGDSDGGDAGPPAAAPAAPAGSAAGVDLSTMTPRDAADRLFDRVMTALATGDTVEAMNFLPMAFQAYDMARPLNEDGLYHVSVLRRAAEDHEGALEAALAGLEDNPNHILNLSSAAEAARDLGDAPAARGYYERLLETWDEEMAQERPEYSNHAPLLPEIQQDARTFLDQDR